MWCRTAPRTGTHARVSRDAQATTDYKSAGAIRPAGFTPGFVGITITLRNALPTLSLVLRWSLRLGFGVLMFRCVHPSAGARRRSLPPPQPPILSHSCRTHQPGRRIICQRHSRNTPVGPSASLARDGGRRALRTPAVQRRHKRGIKRSTRLPLSPPPRQWPTVQRATGREGSAGLLETRREITSGTASGGGHRDENGRQRAGCRRVRPACLCRIWGMPSSTRRR